MKGGFSVDSVKRSAVGKNVGCFRKEKICKCQELCPNNYCNYPWHCCASAVQRNRLAITFSTNHV